MISALGINLDRKNKLKTSNKQMVKMHSQPAKDTVSFGNRSFKPLKEMMELTNFKSKDELGDFIETLHKLDMKINAFSINTNFAKDTKKADHKSFFPTALFSDEMNEILENMSDNFKISQKNQIFDVSKVKTDKGVFYGLSIKKDETPVDSLSLTNLPLN